VPFRYKGKHQLSKDRRVEIVPVGQEKKVEAPVVEEKPATPATPVARPQKAAKAPEGRVTEKVKAGSRLAQIARRHYGNPDYWIYIYEANRDKLSKPSELPVGIELVIPSLEEIKQQEANK
jgi:nucleoid-associated protein YgaU